jgi:hypothetical protein
MSIWSDYLERSRQYEKSLQEWNRLPWYKRILRKKPVWIPKYQTPEEMQAIKMGRK